MSGPTTPLLENTSSDKQRLLGALLAAFRNFELTSDQLLPAVIVSFNRAKNTAVVQPMIQWVKVNNEKVNRHPLANINVLSIGGGGFHISFPLKKGDLGWIMASDRDISLFKQSLAVSSPNTGRLHTFEDGWFVPDVFRQYSINGADTNAMVIQSTDAATRISISNGIVNITAPSSVTVTTPQATFTGNVTVQQNLTVQKNTSVTQALTVTGATAVNGGFVAAAGNACTLPAGTTVSGINVGTHGHVSSSPGSRTSGGMIS